MIVECEKCKSQFNVDEGILKEQGSKVRCSICKNIFFVYPKQALDAEPAPDLIMDEDMEETVALDSPPRLKDQKRSDRGQIDIPMVALDRLTTEGKVFSSFEEPATGVTFEEDRAGESEMFMKKGRQVLPPPISGKMEKSGRSPALAIILIILLVFIGAGVGIYFYFPDLIPDLGLLNKPTVTKTDAKDLGTNKLRIQAQTIESYFVKSDKAGELFVIKGNISNNYSNPRSKILLQVSIFDEQNKVILKKNAYAGNVFTDEELKGISVEQIETAMRNAAGKDNKNLKIEPGTVIPFMVIFNNLPDNAKDFSPDLISSSAGS
jgi:predicted Zn finger-like uncharacterized protein